MEIPITQSKSWQKLQEDLHEESIFIEKKDFQFLAIKKKTPFGNYLYCPYGPVANDAKAFKLALSSLLDHAKQHNCFFIRVEPFDANFTKNLPKNTKKTKDLNPKETWILNLDSDDDTLNSKLPSRLLRYYKSAEKKGITITRSHNPDDIKHLVDLQKALANQKHISTFSTDYLKTELAQPFSTLYLVHYRNPETNQTEIVAAGLVFDDETIRYNLQGAQSDTGRKLHATGILTIQLIKDAKDKGLKAFDFWGIAPENAPKNHPWRGFTEFKKTFAGTQKDHAGTYDIVLNTFKYKLYQVTRAINMKLRKLGWILSP